MGAIAEKLKEKVAKMAGSTLVDGGNEEGLIDKIMKFFGK